jgi:hypothetical protein
LRSISCWLEIMGVAFGEAASKEERKVEMVVVGGRRIKM